MRPLLERVGPGAEGRLSEEDERRLRLEEDDEEMKLVRVGAADDEKTGVRLAGDGVNRGATEANGTVELTAGKVEVVGADVVTGSLDEEDDAVRFEEERLC